MSTFSALPGANVITDENTSITFYAGDDLSVEVIDFMHTPTGGRTLGSLYFKGSVTLLSTGAVAVPAIELWSANLTLAGNLEIEDGQVLDITAMTDELGGSSGDFSGVTASTLTVNGYVDLGKDVASVHKFGARSNLVFNGAIRG